MKYLFILIPIVKIITGRPTVTPRIEMWLVPGFRSIGFENWKSPSTLVPCPVPKEQLFQLVLQMKI